MWFVDDWLFIDLKAYTQDSLTLTDIAGLLLANVAGIAIYAAATLCRCGTVTLLDFFS